MDKFMNGDIFAMIWFFTGLASFIYVLCRDKASFFIQKLKRYDNVAEFMGLIAFFALVSTIFGPLSTIYFILTKLRDRLREEEAAEEDSDEEA